MLIELNQLGQKGKLVVDFQQVGTRLFDGSERGLEVPGGQQRLSFEDSELRETCVRGPLDSRDAVGRRQRALVQHLSAAAIAPGHRDVRPIDVRMHLPDALVPAVTARLHSLNRSASSHSARLACAAPRFTAHIAASLLRPAPSATANASLR